MKDSHHREAVLFLCYEILKIKMVHDYELLSNKCILITIRHESTSMLIKIIYT